MPASNDEPRQWKLNDLLVKIMGNNHVYYEPPEDVKIEYPCIVYSMAAPSVTRADNKVYLHMNCYQLTIITEDPYDTLLWKVINEFEYATPGARYLGDGLYHYPITIYF